MNWLGEKFEGMSGVFGLAKQIDRFCLTGKQDYPAAGHVAADMDRGLDAGHATHHDIRNHHVRLQRRCSLNRILTAVDSGALESLVVEDEYKGIGDESFVIGNQNTGCKLPRMHARSLLDYQMPLSGELRIVSKMACISHLS
jgi:hypothetical protein